MNLQPSMGKFARESQLQDLFLELEPSSQSNTINTQNICQMLAKLGYHANPEVIKAKLCRLNNSTSTQGDEMTFTQFSQLMLEEQRHHDTEYLELMRVFRTLDPTNTGKANIADLRHGFQLTGILGGYQNAISEEEFKKIETICNPDYDGQFLYRKLIQYLLANKPVFEKFDASLLIRGD